MAKDPKTIKNSSDREFSRKVVGVVEHHIKVMKVAPHRVGHTTENMSKSIYGGVPRLVGTLKGREREAEQATALCEGTIVTGGAGGAHGVL